MDALKHNLHILARSPLWAILPDRLPVIASLLTASIIPEWEAAKPHTIGKGATKIAIVPVQGVLTKDGPSWLGSNYDNITSALETFGADPAVKKIVLAVDSPGGEVIGLPETAAALASVAKVKPVSAMVEGMAASAAYWLTSRASDVTLTPSGEVGSVGVRMLHLDVSKMLDNMGITPTELSAGNFKTEWSPFRPVTDEAKADMQARLDSVHKDFIASVHAGRGERTTQVIREARFGEGRMFSATEAHEHGLIDSIQSPRDYYRALIPTSEDETGAPVYGLPRRARLDLEKQKAKV